MEILRAFSQSALFEHLSATDISVSPRGSERTSDETERWSICRLLSTLGALDRFTYPLKVEKSERPDYVISYNGKHAVGVEITEVIHEEFARTLTLPEAQQSDSVVDRSLFRWFDPRRKLQELRQIASQTKLSGPGWEGNSPEIEFADAIMDRLRIKTAKLNEESFGRYDQDWILIYENLYLPNLKKTVASSYLAIALDEYWSVNSFQKIFVEAGQFIIEFSQSETRVHRILDLW
jgi:hypothetical protein